MRERLSVRRWVGPALSAADVASSGVVVPGRALVVRVGRLAGVSLLAVAALAGCSSPSGLEPTPSASASPDSAATPSETPSVAPTLAPGGTADENLPYFDAINSSFLAADPMPGGRAIVDNLVTAGFDKATMQVTADETTIGREVDSVQFSVRFGEQCLIGQSASSGYVGIVAPVFATDRCLIGATRPIDW